MSRSNRIALVMSSLGETQTDKFTPLDLSNLDLRINVTSKNWVDTVKTIEEVLDCIQEEVTSKETTRVLYRLPIEGEFVPVYVAPLAALCYGGAAAPSGGSPANKVITVTVVGDSGRYILNLDYEGIAQDTVKIPFDASAAQFKRIIEDLDSIGYGNTTVTKAGNVYTVTFVSKRGYANIPLFTVTDHSELLGSGAGVTVAQVTAGAQKSHPITEMSGYSQFMTTFGIAFEDEAGSERLLVGATVENLVFNAPANGGKVTFSADIIARSLIKEPGLTIPACQVYRAVRTTDCLLTRNSIALIDAMTEMQYSYSNNTLTGNSAYTGRSVKPSRLERANRRTRSLTYSLLSATDAVTNSLYEEAAANPEADQKRVTQARFGTEGNCIIVNIPNALTELATGGGGITFDGESEEAIDKYVDTPTKISGVAPTNLVAKLNETGTFLIPNTVNP